MNIIPHKQFDGDSDGFVRYHLAEGFTVWHYGCTKCDVMWFVVSTANKKQVKAKCINCSSVMHHIGTIKPS